MQLVLSPLVRVVIAGLLLFSLFVDGAGYWYRIVNHQPLTGNATGLPPHFGDWQLYIHKGLDLAGGTHLELQLTDIPSNRKKSEVQAVAVGVIERRVNALGVSEPSVRAEGSDRIAVDLAGVPAARAQDVIGKTYKLVFTKWVADAAVKGGPAPGFKPAFINLGGDQVTGASAATDTNGQWIVNLNFNSQGADIFGRETQNAVNACPGDTAECAQRHIPAWLDLTQADIDNWAAVADKVGQTSELGGKLISNPRIISPIPGGQAQISGGFDINSAKTLATELNSGALPANIVILQSTDVGASLGSDAIRRSLAAGLLGLLVVIVFMCFYYRLPGFLASLALLFYAGVVLALFKLIPVTLTLAGMAGFILSVGMAVDANVLIFERFKEEMRGGRTIGGAVDAAVRRAYPAIRDSNMSTAITSLILVFLGSGPVKGFAVTLLIGVAISFLSSVVVTQNLLAIVLNAAAVRRPALLGVNRG